jgi:hypothetical protein
MKRKFKKLEWSLEDIQSETEEITEQVADSKHIYETGMSALDREAVVNRYIKIIRAAASIQFAAVAAIAEMRFE